MRTLVWFRGKDLRIADHVPLREAALIGEVVPVFVLDPFFFAKEQAQKIPHRMQFLLDSLKQLAASLEKCGSRLVVVEGRSVDVIPRLVDRFRANRVAAYGWCDPIGRERDRRIGVTIGARLCLYDGETLLPPGTLRNGAGKPFLVFTHFANAFRKAASLGTPFLAPRALPPLPNDLRWSAAAIPECSDLGIEPNLAIQVGGELAARARLRRFVEQAASRYADQRDRMDLAGTSRLSADLKFGTLSVRRVWRDVSDALGDTASGRAFLDELVWREFTHSTLWDRPGLLVAPFRREFQGFPWRCEGPELAAWKQGKTGYPVVDAAARQLLTEGFVHNRARMIAASFLTKHLLFHYRAGEKHYLRYLTDGDLAQNNAGWQWSAGCGCDAQPYFRIFNPVTQGKKFDPHGSYVRRWVPELSRLPERYIHEPWAAPEDVLFAAGVRLGRTYPAPIVDHKYARNRFLETAKTHLSTGYANVSSGAAYSGTSTGTPAASSQVRSLTQKE